LSGVDRYTCTEAFRRLDDYLDRELGPAELAKVREHLEVCAVCAMEFRFEERILADLRSKLAHVAAPPGLLDRVRGAIARAAADRSDS
jgi:anti-sigma factor (TIGR02949 family)